MGRSIKLTLTWTKKKEITVTVVSNTKEKRREKWRTERKFQLFIRNMDFKTELVIKFQVIDLSHLL